MCTLRRSRPPATPPLGKVGDISGLSLGVKRGGGRPQVNRRGRVLLTPGGGRDGGSSRHVFGPLTVCGRLQSVSRAALAAPSRLGLQLPPWLCPGPDASAPAESRWSSELPSRVGAIVLVKHFNFKGICNKRRNGLEQHGRQRHLDCVPVWAKLQHEEIFSNYKYEISRVESQHPW